jgi:glycosyltransferase involved in cell wall biosynthesis
MLKCAPPMQKSYLALSPPVQHEYETMVKAYVEGIFYLELPTWQKYRRTTFNEKLRAPLADTMRIFKLMPSVMQIISIIQKNKINVVHTNNSILAPGAIAAKLTKCPHVWHVREPFGSKLQYHPILGDKTTYFLMKKLCEAIICNSGYTAEPFNDNNIECKIILNGLDIDHFIKYSQGNGQQKDMHLPNYEITLGMVGNITTEWKRHDLFLEVAAILNKSHANLNFMIFGSSNDLHQTDYTNKLAKQIRELQLMEKVVFVDHVREPVEIMNSLDILIHPTLTEGSGRVIMEAMAARKPVVAMSSCGVQELIQDGQTGLLIQSGNVQAMAEKAELLLNNPELRTTIGNNARLYAQEHFSDRESMDSIVKIYEKLIEERVR